MSAFTKVKTVLKDLNKVKKALVAMGWAEEKIEVHDKPAKLNGYHNNNNEAHLIIRRKHLGPHAYNDIGFLQQADGSVQAIVGDYNERTGGMRGQHGHMEGTWLKTLSQEYSLVSVEEELQMQGYFIENVERSTDGKIYVSAENPLL